MSKLWLKHQKFMKGNAGFSLVELIIVIAIMAALVAILAPQYLKYVDKSRKAADAATAEEILTACKVAATESTCADSFTATWNGTTLVIAAVTSGADVAAEQGLVATNLGTTYGSGIAIAAKYSSPTTYVVTVTTGATPSVAVTTAGWFS